MKIIIDYYLLNSKTCIRKELAIVLLRNDELLFFSRIVQPQLDHELVVKWRET